MGSKVDVPGTFLCPVCNMSFNSKFGVRIHRMLGHPIEYDVDVLAQASKKLSCLMGSSIWWQWRKWLGWGAGSRCRKQQDEQYQDSLPVIRISRGWCEMSWPCWCEFSTRWYQQCGIYGKASVTSPITSIKNNLITHCYPYYEMCQQVCWCYDANYGSSWGTSCNDSQRKGWLRGNVNWGPRKVNKGASAYRLANQ